jgi:hypothetical protein
MKVIKIKPLEVSEDMLNRKNLAGRQTMAYQSGKPNNAGSTYLPR